ncbi:MAG: ATP-dependent metallopeptidase FtsH/Yme1/Tma family protein [Mesorhizobium sp.]|uniref:ATP-dependent zinc metalloprotease FtsH n=1 Tax=Mesorhizobium sp. TaxID=1871066 RepID=UPI000FE8E025|nr:ATP-dependent zinc metalloprotease FtsH [Mesorhizobium sp.]RWH82157.1 MAG: ATP-dependent metallopeptidase FtsH/Yme1/Tma family protein [Mesorhizobium sp.]RWH85158.1 MAG: ATP-dependent metallopeptidase FtsH/Yme1/Tma family protein [Mesorhizobium sp.]RWH89913.1 MAG: ATP-dependent metallopeptidase FtsH/Yme1/Tma family protein [Mesorhizobium sp.]RWH98337.1 MAG: ATP-dependent metallopeptidase FtsH/Yme1/Tma family protein [Mesorhizobium sp.]RWI04655.1 MAG: ATP-dependent metallopeptidase FtsH/Yme1
MDMSNRKTQFNIWYWIAAFAAMMLFQYIYTATQHVAQIPYSRFETLLRDGKIADVQVSDRFIQGSFKEPQDGKPLFITTRVDPNLARQLQEHGVTVTGQIESTFLSDLLSWVVPILVFFGLWMLLMRRMGGGVGGLMQIGRSKARVYVEANTGVRFDDVAGVDEAKAELQEIVDFLRSPQEYGRLGGRMPKGVLLVGPPGTGKTLLAKAVAGEAKVPFFSISGSEFVEMFVGIGAARVRDLFEQARAKAPAIIFIDELDALGRARGAGPMMGGHDEKEQTLNQLLVELDGFDPKIGVVLLAATNRPEILDPALLRAGRFDRQVLVDRPDKQGRVQILQVHMKKAKLAADVDAEKVAALTPGFTGADLANLVNEATLLPTRRKADVVTMDDFNNAVERIVAGLEKRNRLLNPREREVVAYHEMGHALVAMALPGVDPVHKVSIIPRGVGALGYTIQRPTEDRFLMTREELENKMAVLLGGRAAEWIVFGHLSTGAADDLAKVTDIARAMVTRYGMSKKLGHVALEKDQRSFLSPNPLAGGPREHDYGEATADAIDAEVRDIIDTAFERTVGLLTERRDILERTARRLLETETLGEAELTAIMKGSSPRDGAAPGESSGSAPSGKSTTPRGKATETISRASGK